MNHINIPQSGPLVQTCAFCPQSQEPRVRDGERTGLWECEVHYRQKAESPVTWAALRSLVGCYLQV